MLSVFSTCSARGCCCCWIPTLVSLFSWHRPVTKVFNNSTSLRHRVNSFCLKRQHCMTELVYNFSAVYGHAVCLLGPVDLGRWIKHWAKTGLWWHRFPSIYTSGNHSGWSVMTVRVSLGIKVRLALSSVRSEDMEPHIIIISSVIHVTGVPEEIKRKEVELDPQVSQYLFA